MKVEDNHEDTEIHRSIAHSSDQPPPARASRINTVLRKAFGWREGPDQLAATEFYSVKVNVLQTTRCRFPD